MAFTVTVNKGTYSVGKNLKMGTYASDGGSTGGAIKTGLRTILYSMLLLQHQLLAQ